MDVAGLRDPHREQAAFILSTRSFRQRERFSWIQVGWLECLLGDESRRRAKRLEVENCD